MAQMRVLVGDLYVHESCQRKSLIFGVGDERGFAREGQARNSAKLSSVLISSLCATIDWQRHNGRARSEVVSKGAADRVSAQPYVRLSTPQSEANFGETPR
jgi:hypothetical protein